MPLPVLHFLEEVRLIELAFKVVESCFQLGLLVQLPQLVWSVVVLT